LVCEKGSMEIQTTFISFFQSLSATVRFFDRKDMPNRKKNKRKAKQEQQPQLQQQTKPAFLELAGGGSGQSAGELCITELLSPKKNEAKQQLQTFKVPTSSVLASVMDFLPKMKAANSEIEKRIAEEGQEACNIEAVDRTGENPYVEMDLHCGLFEAEKQVDEQSVSNATADLLGVQSDGTPKAGKSPAGKRLIELIAAEDFPDVDEGEEGDEGI